MIGGHMDEAYWMEFLKQYQKKYGYIAEIQRITKELGDALGRNDKVAAQLLLGMRSDEMAGVDLCEKNIGMLLENMEQAQRKYAVDCMEGRAEPEEAEKVWVSKIRDLQTKMKSILQDTISRDKVINQRLAGDKSFYVSRAK